MTKDEIEAEIKSLCAKQREERGTQWFKGLGDKKTRIPGPYVGTPEREARARRIIELRKKAARLT